MTTETIKTLIEEWSMKISKAAEVAIEAGNMAAFVRYCDKRYKATGYGEWAALRYEAERQMKKEV